MQPCGVYTVGGALIREGLWETHTCWFPLGREMILYITLTVKTHLQYMAARCRSTEALFLLDSGYITLCSSIYTTTVRKEREVVEENMLVCISIPFYVR